MISDNRRIATNTLILYMRLMVTTVLGLFNARCVLKLLGESNLVLYRVVAGFVLMLNMLNVSMTSSSYRYIAYELGKEGIEGVNRIFNISLLVHIIFAIIVLFIGETLGLHYVTQYLNVPEGKSGDAVFVFHFSIFAMIANVISIPFRGLVTALEKFSVRAYIEILSSGLAFLIAIGLMAYNGNRLRYYAVLMGFSWVLASLLFVGYCKRFHPSIVGWNLQTDKAKYKEMLSFSGWIMLGTASEMGKNQGAAMIINYFFGTVLNASFGVARRVNDLVRTFSGNLIQVAVPQITKNYSSGNRERSVDLVCYITKYSFFLLMIPALPIFLEADFLLDLWLDEVPAYASIFCRLMIANALIDSLGGLASVAQASGKIKYFLIALSTTSLLSLPIAAFLFKMQYPPYTILVTYIVTSTLNIGTWNYLAKKILNFDVKRYATQVYLKVLCVCIAVLPLFGIRELFAIGLMRFLILSGCAVIWNLVAIYFLGMDRREKKLIGDKLALLLKKLGLNQFKGEI